jgi:hypothetical protein
MCGCVGVGVGGCVYKIEKFRTLSAPSEIASLREAISSSAAFELIVLFVRFFRISIEPDVREYQPKLFWNPLG